MKYQEITFKSIAQGFRHQWFVIILSVVVFVILGFAVSFLWSDRLSAEGQGSAAPLNIKSMDTLEMDQNYYRQYYTQLQKHSDNLFQYMNMVSLDHTINQAQTEMLHAAIDTVTEYQEKVLAPINEKLSELNTIYIPEEIYQETLQDYEEQNITIQESLVISESAVELLKSMGAVTSTDAAVNETYATLLAQAARYGTLQIDLQHNAAILDQLNNEPQQIRRQSDEVESQLKQAYKKLETLGEEVHSLLQDIAVTNHLNLAATLTGEELQVTVSHTNRPATAEEATMAMMVFCGLMGVAAGVYFAMWRETKKGNA